MSVSQEPAEVYVKAEFQTWLYTMWASEAQVFNVYGRNPANNAVMTHLNTHHTHLNLSSFRNESKCKDVSKCKVRTEKVSFNNS